MLYYKIITVVAVCLKTGDYIIQKTDFRQRRVGANAVILKKNFLKAFLKLFYRPADDLSYIIILCNEQIIY